MTQKERTADMGEEGVNRKSLRLYGYEVARDYGMRVRSSSDAVYLHLCDIANDDKLYVTRITLFRLQEIIADAMQLFKQADEVEKAQIAEREEVSVLE